MKKILDLSIDLESLSTPQLRTIIDFYWSHTVGYKDFNWKLIGRRRGHIIFKCFTEYPAKGIRYDKNEIIFFQIGKNLVVERFINDQLLPNRIELAEKS